jgi:hypothetical protein
MLALLSTTVFLVAITAAIPAYGTVYWIRYLRKRYAEPDGNFRAETALRVLTSTAVVLLMLHLLEVVVWALAYRPVLPSGPLASFVRAVYFSVVTFATLGYGDITLVDHEWRVISGIEALNGVLLVGWTTALLFAVFQCCWKGLAGGRHQ